MIIETRNIIFSDEEIVLALKPLLQAKGQDPDLLPEKLQCGTDTSDEVTVTYQLRDGSEILFNSREVGAAVLNHCIELGIPLPRGSMKELATRGDHIALIVRLETGVTGPGIEDDDE